MPDEIKSLQRRLELLAAQQREIEARLRRLEDSRVFRILQRAGSLGNSVKARLLPGLESEARKRTYRDWLASRVAAPGGVVTLPDYEILIASGGRLTPNALCDLAAAVQQERYEALYGDEDHGDAPLLKPDWSPELIGSPNYLGRFLVARRDVFEAAGQTRDPIELARKLLSSGARFHRIPKILASFENSPMVWAPPSAPRIEGTPLASIVICSRNAKLLESCFAGIGHDTAYPHREVVVVEHNLDRPAEGHSYTRVPYSGAFNFAAMNNLGAKSAKGEVLVFLNDDVRPLDEAWLGALVAQAQRPEVGVAGALLLYPNGSIQHSGIALGIHGYTGHPGRGTLDGGFWPWVFVTRNVSAVTGACLAIRREVFDQLGGFDPKFPVNFNDVDLCLRAGDAGYEVILEAAARLRHDESRTRRRGVAWEEIELFLERWGDRVESGDPYYHPALTLTGEDCSLA